MVSYASSLSKMTHADMQVNFARIPSIANWKRDFTLETVLVELRRSVRSGNLFRNHADVQRYGFTREPKEPPASGRYRVPAYGSRGTCQAEEGLGPSVEWFVRPISGNQAEVVWPSCTVMIMIRSVSTMISVRKGHRDRVFPQVM